VEVEPHHSASGCGMRGRNGKHSLDPVADRAAVVGC
jgi:hypothetical protein